MFPFSRDGDLELSVRVPATHAQTPHCGPGLPAAPIRASPSQELHDFCLKLWGNILRPHQTVATPLVMAPPSAKPVQSGPVRIRLNSLEGGTTPWKEGSFEIHESDNKVTLCLKFHSCGAPKIFQLKQNVKNVVLGSMRLVLTLKDSRVVMFDKVPVTLAQKTKEYLEKLKQGKQTVLKTSQGSVSFGGVLGSRSLKNECATQLSCVERQAPPKRASLDSREEAPPRPPRLTPKPARSGPSELRSERRKRLMVSDGDLSEDYPKENDSCSNNKATSDVSWKFLLSCKEKLKQSEENRSSGPLQPSPFYSSRSGTKDLQGRILDRASSTSQSPSSKRSLLFPSHSTPFKRARPSGDSEGNKPRAPLLAPLLAPIQPQLQGFSNLGNTCYMNAILQSLFSLQSFSNDLIKQNIPWRKERPAPLCIIILTVYQLNCSSPLRFAHLLAKKDTSSPEMKKELLRRVKGAISSTAERFSGYMQNDAHEFLSQCLDQLKDDVEKVNKSLKSEPCDEEASRIYACPVGANMELEVQDTILCKGCGAIVTKRERFNDLSLDLPRRKSSLPLWSVQDSLDLFFRMEEVEYSCEKCCGKSATVTHKFSKLPRVLVLHLKRYSYNAQLSLYSKLAQRVLIPRSLSLLAHCTDSTQPPLSLGGTASRTLKTSQSVNSTLSRRGCVKPGSPTVSLDSDSEDELVRKAVGRKRRLGDGLGDEGRAEKACCDLQTDLAPHSGIQDEEMLVAALEMSRQEASSPDTGFSPDPPDLGPHADLLDPDRAPTDALASLGPNKDPDENKENQTPEEVQGDAAWLQLYGPEQEREELQQALAQSLQEHEAREMREDDDLKRATELSLQEFNNSITELLCSDDDSGNDDLFDSETEAEEQKRVAEAGEGNSFRLLSVVSHIGSSSSSGHYVSDVYDMKKQSWLTYNDLDVSRTQESSVQRDRDRSGYIFFYMQRDLFEELSDMERTGGNSDVGRTVLQPL
ncbi:hypothetical protein AAFF_G00314050 [Aldrovandia affinis]|uniref:Ubiquitin carboxyl-terminal hydrolase n=1 Tax=Aldrovandia affinis TaxID=143900 RepID=A0AAD7R7F6_9TELE|nr:hypothetical protein AAFF_G00314050 [Aldrovandia affinis]